MKLKPIKISDTVVHKYLSSFMFHTEGGQPALRTTPESYYFQHT